MGGIPAVNVGPLYAHGAQAWPDQILDASNRGLLLGGACAIGLTAVGFELHGGRGRNPWLAIYAGWWAFELYWDHDRSWEA